MNFLSTVHWRKQKPAFCRSYLWNRSDFQPEVPPCHFHCQSALLSFLQPSDFLATGEMALIDNDNSEHDENESNVLSDDYCLGSGWGDQICAQKSLSNRQVFKCFCQRWNWFWNLATWRTTSPMSTTTTQLHGATDGEGMVLKVLLFSSPRMSRIWRQVEHNMWPCEDCGKNSKV